MGSHLPHAPKNHTAPPPIFGSCLLWPNGWMHQGTTWYGGRPRPRRHCVRCDPGSPSRGAQPPIFGPCLLWPKPNGWMDQDASWHGGRTRPWRHCVRWGPIAPPSPSPKKTGTTLPIFGPCLMWPNGRPSQLLLSSCSLITIFIIFRLYYTLLMSCFADHFVNAVQYHNERIPYTACRRSRL